MAKTPDYKKELDKALSELAKIIGPGMIHRASETPAVNHNPFRNPHLNYITDGGLPWNRFSSLIGDPSVGKTLAGYEMIVTGQGLPATADVLLEPRIKYHDGLGHTKIVARLKNEREWIHDNFPNGAECCFHDIEGQFDKKRAQKLGIDTDRLFIAESNIIEEIGTTLQWLYPVVHIHVLDSTSNASSQLELKQEPGKSLVGTDARQWKKVLRSSQTFFGPVKNGTGIPNMVVMVHQMSTNVGTGAVQQATGRYIRFLSSMTIKFTRGSFLWDVDGVLKEDKPTKIDERSHAGRAEADGVAVLAQVDKSRTCRPFMVGSLQFDYRKLIYTAIHELATTGIYHGLINQSGSWFSIPGEEGNLGQGLRSVYARLADDEALRDEILCRLLDNYDDDDRGIVDEDDESEGDVEAALEQMEQAAA